MIRELICVWLIAAALTEEPKCQVVSNPIIRTFVSESQTQLLQLSDYLHGYNLSFSPMDGLIPPFYRSNVEPLPISTDGFSLVGIDMLTNTNKAWSERGGVLLDKDDSMQSIVLFGALNNYYNLKLNKIGHIFHNTPVICMDIAMVGIESAVLDCQDFNANDIVYLVEITGVTKVELGPGIKVTGIGRKSIIRRTNSTLLILSATLTDHVDQQAKGNTQISVYKVNLETKQITALAAIKADSLGQEKLFITDISIDNSGRISITDDTFGIISFNYEDNKISAISKAPVSNPKMITSFISPSGDQIFFIATNSAIIQAEWKGESLIPSRYYELPDTLNEVVDLQASSSTIMVSSQSNYYFYRLGEIRAKDLMQVVAKQGTVGVMDQQSSQAIVVGKLNSVGYMVTNGYLQIYGAMKKTQLILEATSVSETGNQSCSVIFQLNLVTDDKLTDIYATNDPLAVQTVQTPAKFNLFIDDYMIGSRLKYKPVTSAGIIEKIKHMEVFTVNSSVGLQDASFISTFSTSPDKYYRISKQESIYTAQFCSYNKNLGQVDCLTSNTFKIDGIILTYDFVILVIDKISVPLMAFVSDTSSNMVHFQPLIGNPPPSPLRLEFSVQHISANDLYLFIIIKDNPEIQIYSLLTYFQINKITTESFTTSQLAEIVRFKPRAVSLSPSNPNIIFIKNLQSVILMKFSSTGLLWICNIRATARADNTIQWEVIVTGNNLGIIVKDGTNNSITEYALQDFFRPIRLKEINVLGDVFTDKLECFNAFGSDFIFVKVNRGNGIALTVYKLGVPLVQSNYYQQNITTTSVVSVNRLFDDIIIQILSPQSSFTRIAYHRPQLQVEASIPAQSFKKKLIYGLVLQGLKNFTMFTTNLTVFNYQTKIIESATPNDQIPFPQNAQKLWIELSLSDMFNGSVTHHKIDCHYCDQGKIALVDHVTSLTKTTALPSRPTKLLTLKSKQAIFVLTSLSLSAFSYDGSLIKQITLEYLCLNLVEYSNSQAILICFNQTNQLIIPFEIQTMILAEPIVIPDNFRVRSPIKMLIIKENDQLMILDNTIRADGNGFIRQFTITNKQGRIIDIQPMATIDYVNFGCRYKVSISDISILNSTKTNSIVLATLANFGIGYVSYTPQGWQGSSIQLMNEPKILDYILDDNRFLQVLVLNKNLNTATQIKNTLILTMSSGAHLEVILTLDWDEHKYVYNAIDILNIFNKYGNQIVLNSAEFHPIASSNVLVGWLMVSYYNDDRNSLTFSLYQVPVDNQTSPINFKSSHLLQNITIARQSTVPFVLYTVLSEIHLVAPSNERVLTFSNVSSSAYLLLNYDTPDLNCTSIKITAINDYSMCQHNIPVKFAGDNSGLGWYVWLLISLGVLFIVGMIYGLYRFVQKKIRASKQVSLLTEDEEPV